MTFTKEQLIAQAEGNITMLRASLEHVKDPFERDDISTDLRLAEIALASLEAEPVLYAAEETLVYSKHGELHLTCLSEPMGDAVIPLYSAPPAPVVEDIGEISVGRLPTMNQDDYPGLGDWWVQLRTGKDSDEVLARVYGATPQEANGRAEALACRAAMLQGAAGNSPAIPDSYDIESFGIFRASEGSSGFNVEIEQFRFGTEKCPQIGKTHMVPKFALQAIINALQQHCDRMEEVPSLAEEVNREAK